jgi:hypothetical protein
MKFPADAFLALLCAGAVQAACTTNLLIDNYANFANNLNSLGQWTGGECARCGSQAGIDILSR